MDSIQNKPASAAAGTPRRSMRTKKISLPNHKNEQAKKPKKEQDSKPLKAQESKEVVTTQAQVEAECSEDVVDNEETLLYEVENLSDSVIIVESNCSIISIPDSPSVAQKTIASEVPPMTIVQEGMKDSAFGPVVVETFNDSHPVFENESIAHRFPLRTNTPLALRNMGFLTGAIPKQSCPGKLSLAQFQTPGKTPRMKRTEPLAESEDDSIAQLKSVYPLEKSILKATRKRSLSVTDAEVYQKRVMFISPKVKEIGEIDEQMMASYIEDQQENAMMRQAAGSSHRKRSLSTGTPLKVLSSGVADENNDRTSKGRGKIPNFAAIHERVFKRMESIQDHYLRKVERAKNLTTPLKSNDIKSKAEISRAASKIPSLKARKPPVENTTSGRTLKRSLSASDEAPRKKTQTANLTAGTSSSGAKNVNDLQRSKSEEAETEEPNPSTSKAFQFNSTPVLTSSGPSVVEINRVMIKERHDKNMGLLKTNALQGSTLVTRRRTRNSEFLKGVRLNRRFNLQMQHRQDQNEQQKE